MPALCLNPALRTLIAASTVCLVTACGGGGNDAPATPAPSQPAASGPPPISRVIVAGDSLADVGTFGFKATVQSAANPAVGYPIYPQLVAQQLGAGALCNYFSSTDQGKTFTTHAARV